MKQRNLWLLVGAGLVAVGLLGWAFAPRPLEVELAEVTQGPFETTVDDDARTRLRERYSVQAPLAGRLERIRLREGDAVAAGDIVARLTPVLSPLLDARTQAEQQARLGAADAARQRAAAAVAGARVALQQARNEQQRSEQLASQGFVGPAKLDADRLSAQAAQRALEAAVEGERVSGHEWQMARAALGAVRAPSTAAGGFAVPAPVAGRVLKVHVASEATVPLGAPLLDIGDTSRLDIVAELLTTDALALRAGLPVRVERWGGPGTLEGRVARIEPAAFTKVSALGVEEQRVTFGAGSHTNGGTPTAGNGGGSAQTPAGFLVTKPHHGRLYQEWNSVGISGMGSENGNTAGRGVIIHPSNGHTLGCIGIPPSRFVTVKRSIAYGSVVLNYFPGQIGNSQNRCPYYPGLQNKNANRSTAGVQ